MAKAMIGGMLEKGIAGPK
ncbi:MAG: hypothetical protein PUG54_10065, partial [Firmicutes bacterium]|nr:hypothetical protein [Bacillota bacterium]